MGRPSPTCRQSSGAKLGDSPPPGRQGCLFRNDDPGQPRDGGLPLPPRFGRARTADRCITFELFPALASQPGALAGSLSGGQQQMLALAITLLHDPKVLIIDELSLGLAPLVVQQLIGVLDQLRAKGMSMIIVEQSLNVAAAIADRAVFLPEKGRVRFEGAMRELIERDDLARAVFLGGAAEGL